MKSIIGKLYRPYDNSYCINISTKEHAFIVQVDLNDPEFSSYHPYPIEEDGAQFEVVSEPYEEHVSFFGDHVYEFINVKSSVTGEVYRTLYEKYFLDESRDEYHGRSYHIPVRTFKDGEKINRVSVEF